MRARYYNVSIMRFINQDVVHGNLSDSQSLNRFAYVEGNPINFLDPFGLEKWRSVYYLEHELMDKWSNILMIINSFALAASRFCSPVSYTGRFLSALMTTINAISVFIASYNALIYFSDIIDASLYGGSEEDIANALDGFDKSIISICLGSVGMEKLFLDEGEYVEYGVKYWNLVMNNLDPLSTSYFNLDDVLEIRHRMNLQKAKILKKMGEKYWERESQQ